MFYIPIISKYGIEAFCDAAAILSGLCNFTCLFGLMGYNFPFSQENKLFYYTEKGDILLW